MAFFAGREFEHAFNQIIHRDNQVFIIDLRVIKSCPTATDQTAGFAVGCDETGFTE